MVTIRLAAVVGEDRQLTITVPETIPPGPVELVIESRETGSIGPINRNVARARLTAAGKLSTAHNPLPGMPVPTDEEVRAAGVLPPNVRPSEDLVAEDRDEV